MQDEHRSPDLFLESCQAIDELAHLLCRVLVAADKASSQGVDHNQVRLNRPLANFADKRLKVGLLSNLHGFQEKERSWKVPQLAANHPGLNTRANRFATLRSDVHHRSLRNGSVHPGAPVSNRQRPVQCEEGLAVSRSAVKPNESALLEHSINEPIGSVAVQQFRYRVEPESLVTVIGFV